MGGRPAAGRTGAVCSVLFVVGAGTAGRAACPEERRTRITCCDRVPLHLYRSVGPVTAYSLSRRCECSQAVSWHSHLVLPPPFCYCRQASSGLNYSCAPNKYCRSFQGTPYTRYIRGTPSSAPKIESLDVSLNFETNFLTPVNGVRTDHITWHLLQNNETEQ